MPSTDLQLKAIEQQIEQCRDEFGDAPVIERQDTPDPETFEQWRALSEDGYVGSAYALVRRQPADRPPLSASMPDDLDERPSTLLIRHRGGTLWAAPGGGHEAGETMAETVVREVTEETGIDCTPTSINHFRHEISTCEGYDERLHCLRVFFHGTYTDGSISIQPSELNGAAWFETPPEESQLTTGTRRLYSESIELF
ncbi:NUDIX domain-containing protein [Halocatena halophila]|uniref:NUDIX domain-containing protein n=1 Tax=Halocatena halophila TaxID=2814576 RepID=UPI002ED41FC6